MKDNIFKYFVKLSILMVSLSCLFLISYILLKGVPHLKLSLFSFYYTSENVSLMPALITTLYIIILTLFVGFPIGLFTSIYMVEYANQSGIFYKLMKASIEALSGVPSIIYGLFGYLFFVSKFSYSVLSGSLTLSMMILPFITRATQESLLEVPNSYREASLALGTSKLYMIFKVVLPQAIAGIVSGLLLAIGRIVGESAALIYTLGTVATLPNNLLASGRTLSIHMWALSSEGFYTDQAYATAVILLLLVLFMNSISILIKDKLTKG
ncbi:MAG TPA: phosphate ABC transporter permease PstA [Erysipelothrix sp.]|nr:phosphate ABC transporter permease PstA [Erysipelothrix sp.]